VLVLVEVNHAQAVRPEPLADRVAPSLVAELDFNEQLLRANGRPFPARPPLGCGQPVLARWRTQRSEMSTASARAASTIAPARALV
jgi:hypothetical protein